MRPTNDPAAYRSRCTPLPNVSEGEKRLDKLYEGVRKLAIEYGIRDVHVIAEFDVTHEDGTEGTYSNSYHCGAVDKSLPMLAAEYGRAREQWEKMLAAMLRSKP